MGYWELFKKRIIIATFNLKHVENEVEIEEKIETTIEPDKLYALLIFFQIKTTFYLIQSPSLLIEFLDFLADLKNNDYDKWRTVNQLPYLENYQIFVFKNKPYVEESPENRNATSNEIDQLAISTYCLIHFFEKINERSFVQGFLGQFLTDEFIKKNLSSIEWHKIIQPLIDEATEQLFLPD